MKNFKFRFFLATFSLMSVLVVTFSANAAPVKFNEVVQVVNAKPGNAKTGAFAQLRLANDLIIFGDNDGDDDTNTPQQDDRVITETKTEIVEDEVCDCKEPPPGEKTRFPKWILLGLAAIPIAFIVTRDKKTPTPTPTTPTMTPTITPTPTPTMTPTPTITPTPTPPPEPVPEPMTILLFGTGLAGIGMAARRKFGKKGADKTEE